MLRHGHIIGATTDLEADGPKFVPRISKVTGKSFDKTSRRGPTKLYGQMTNVLRSQITGGVWPEGTSIPSLDELSKTYGVARTTVQKAIQSLVTEGFLSTQRGRRTFVALQKHGKQSQRVFSWLGFGLMYQTDYSAKILHREIVEKLPPGCFLGNPDGPYVWLKKVDYVGKTPFCFSSMYISKRIHALFPERGDEMETSRLVRDLASPPLASAKERMIVSTADIDASKYLEYPLSAPVAKARRVFCDAQENVVYYAESIYRGDMYGAESDLMAYLVRSP